MFFVVEFCDLFVIVFMSVVVVVFFPVIATQNEIVKDETSKKMQSSHTESVTE